MTLAEIKQAITDGKKVYWSNKAYEVIKDSVGQYLIGSNFSGTPNYTGLTWVDGVTMNGKESEFFTGEDLESRDSDISHVKDTLQTANNLSETIVDLEETLNSRYEDARKLKRMLNSVKTNFILAWGQEAWDDVVED